MKWNSAFTSPPGICMSQPTEQTLIMIILSASSRELCTRYGELFAIWLDGAKGDGAPDFTYDFDRYYEVIRTYQPNAVIAVSGPDVRWIGNEAGNARVSEWSVVTANDEALDPALGTLPHISYDAPDMGGRGICFPI